MISGGIGYSSSDEEKNHMVYLRDVCTYNVHGGCIEMLCIVYAYQPYPRSLLFDVWYTGVLGLEMIKYERILMQHSHTAMTQDTGKISRDCLSSCS